MTTRPKLIIIALLLITLNIGTAPSFAAPTLKGKCTKLNTFTQIGNKIAICSKNGSKLIWTLATSAQNKVYQKQQSQQKLVTDRKKTIAEVMGIKETYLDLTEKITALNTVLIDTKRVTIQGSKDQLIGLPKQMEALQQTKVTYETNLQEAIKNINIEQPLVNYFQNEMNIQQAVVDKLKASYDVSNVYYLSAKAQAESLLNEFKWALKKYTDNLVWFTAQKNQIDSDLSDTESKIANLDLLINQSLTRLVTLENAEKRISQDLQKHSEIRALLESRSADLVAAIDSFLSVADANFISTTSAANWDSKYLGIVNIQKDIDSSLIEIKELAISLENFLKTL